MADKSKLISNPERESITVNIQKKQVDQLRAIKKATKIPIARIVDQLINEPLDKAYKSL